jgi:hypothetical protein
MRKLTGHRVNGKDHLRISVVDKPAPSGASSLYLIQGFDSSSNPAAPAEAAPHTTLALLFQNGPLRESGANGITHEALLTILIDRLSGFQTGPLGCWENETALACTRCALAALQARTRDRLRRSVEGSNRV